MEAFLSDGWKVPGPLHSEGGEMHGCQLQMLGAQDGGVGDRMWWSELSLSLAARPTAVRGRGETESGWIGAGVEQ